LPVSVIDVGGDVTATSVTSKRPGVELPMIACFAAVTATPL
jgi:hypothetical protein